MVALYQETAVTHSYAGVAPALFAAKVVPRDAANLSCIGTCFSDWSSCPADAPKEKDVASDGKAGSKRSADSEAGEADTSAKRVKTKEAATEVQVQCRGILPAAYTA